MVRGKHFVVPLPSAFLMVLQFYFHYRESRRSYIQCRICSSSWEVTGYVDPLFSYCVHNLSPLASMFLQDLDIRLCCLFASPGFAGLPEFIVCIRFVAYPHKSNQPLNCLGPVGKKPIFISRLFVLLSKDFP